MCDHTFRNSQLTNEPVGSCTRCGVAVEVAEIEADDAARHDCVTLPEVRLHTEGMCPGECEKCPREWYSPVAARTVSMTPVERAEFIAAYYPELS